MKATVVYTPVAFLYVLITVVLYRYSRVVVSGIFCVSYGAEILDKRLRG